MKTRNDDRGSGESAPVTNKERGAEIERRRRALGLTSLRAFEEAMGDDPIARRDTLGKVEEGTAAPRTYSAVEAWLSRQEEEIVGYEPPATESSPIRVTFHDVTTSSIGEIIVEGPSDQPSELIATITRLLAEVRKGSEK